MKKATEASPGFCLPVDTPLGCAVIRYRKDPTALTEIRLPRPGQSCKGMAREDDPPPAVLAAARELGRYFAGEEPRVDWDLLDFSGLTERMQAILRCCAEIPYGTVTSYGELARRAGMPGAARFAGNTMSRNPFPVFIPCHRVVHADGGLGGFSGGLDLKTKLLDLERSKAGR
ncbi:MAG: methylated-DNA--[protein]-cysteine S-methyltransferase [Thermodesulfobacteriota bacterium]